MEIIVSINVVKYLYFETGHSVQFCHNVENINTIPHMEGVSVILFELGDSFGIDVD